MSEPAVVLGGLSGENGESFFDAKKGYTSKEVDDKLKDPSGGSKTEMPTAVPSPFARFDLVATAFKNIIKNDKLEADKSGDTIKASRHDMQLVSHTLDLAEIIFNRNGYFGNNLEILTWNRKDNLNELDKHPKNKKFAASLKLYLEQDKESYNFDKMENVYLFKYGGCTIGSTSPITLFCPSASVADLVGLKITRLVGGTAFSDEYLPLYKRADDFQKWFYYLLKAFEVAGYSENLKDIFNYARKSRDILRDSNKNLWEEIHKIEQIQRESGVSADFNFMAKNYAVMRDKHDAKVEILGVTLGIANDDLGNKFKNSDYVINTDIYSGTDKPLVLQKGLTLKGFKYLDSDFPSNADVPYYNPKPWDSKRNMPAYDGLEWHYLTVSDFLEPYLVRTIYPISKKFRNFGGQSDSNDNGYLLPLKKDFFRFFSIEDLELGKKVKLSMVPQDGGKTVEVTLKVPIQKGEFITFRRIYKEGESSQMDKNVIDGGIIVQAKFGVTIFPFVKVKVEDPKDDIKINYRVQLVDSDRNLKYVKYSLEFYSQKEPIDPIGSNSEENKGDNRIRSDKTKDIYSASSTYYRVQESFDFVRFEVKNSEIAAIIIPEMKVFNNNSSGSKLTFAVDFGTTNTYVAYKRDGGLPQAFDLSNAVASLFDETDKTVSKIRQNGAGDIIDLIDKEFVPREIGRSNSDANHFTFPQRTAMSYNTDIPDSLWGDGLDTLMEGNIPFGYEKTIQKNYTIDTNLKWDDPNDEFEKSRHERKAYLEQLAMLMQAKVMCENASLKESKLIWFYPLAMKEHERDDLEALWKQHFKKYFLCDDDNLDKRLIKVIESLAPFYDKAKDDPVHGEDAFVVSVDIGGGTTDVAMFLGGILKATTSFKFAGDALFGTYPEDKNANKNGFIRRCIPKFKKLLEDGNYIVAQNILDELLETNRASDINAFLFSIENSIKFWAKDKNMSSNAAFSYTVMLQRHLDLKFLILYFYVALIFHISKVLKSKQLEVNGKSLNVQYLMFSGTASKMLHILGDKKRLEKYTRKIFQELQLNDDVEVKLEKDPKEITCNGGLRADITKIEADKKKKAQNLIYTCIEGNEITDNKPIENKPRIKYSDYQSNSESIKAALIDFHKFLFKLNEDDDYSFENFFGIPETVTSYVQKNYEKSIKRWLDDSFNQNIFIKNKNENVTETHFFVPLKGVISELSERIANGEIK